MDLDFFFGTFSKSYERIITKNKNFLCSYKNKKKYDQEQDKLALLQILALKFSYHNTVKR